MAKLKLKTAEDKTSEIVENWNILIVDDDPEIHAMSKLVMKDWVFQNRGMNLIFANSSFQARKILEDRSINLALVLLDVVMENDHSGLDLVKYIRDIQKNHLVRIILRTGQPGKAPIRKVITEYEINDYKEKNELTADKLFVSVTAALRSYEQISEMAEKSGADI